MNNAEVLSSTLDFGMIDNGGWEKSKLTECTYCVNKLLNKNKISQDCVETFHCAMFWSDRSLTHLLTCFSDLLSPCIVACVSLHCEEAVQGNVLGNCFGYSFCKPYSHEHFVPSIILFIEHF